MARNTYRLVLCGVEYFFKEKKDLESFVESHFKYALDKKGVYDSIVGETLEALTYHAISQGESGVTIDMFNTEKYMTNNYGHIFDPDGELLKFTNDPNGVLNSL